MNIDIAETPLVLMCSGWKRWGTAKTVSKNTVILHARADDVVPYAFSEELVNNSGLPPEALIEVGKDHWLSDPEPLQAMLDACERLVGSGHSSGLTFDRPSFEDRNQCSR